MGRGQASGWKNLRCDDSRRHSLASKGVKSAQNIPSIPNPKKQATIQDFMQLVDEIKEMDTYKQILKDSFGGVMYNVANKDKYNKDINKKFKELEKMGFSIWDTTGGIFRGVHGFIMKD